MKSVKTTDQISEFYYLKLLSFSIKNNNLVRCYIVFSHPWIIVISSDFTVKQICYPKIDFKK